MDSINTNNNINTTTQTPSLMEKISSTINSLMPNSKDSVHSTTTTKSPLNNMYDLNSPVVTSTESYNSSPTNLEKDLNVDTPSSNDSGSSSGISGILKNTYFKILLLILIMAFLGFNLFKYLANAADTTTDIFGDPIKKVMAFLGSTIGDTSKKIIGISAEGTKLATDVAAGATEDVIDMGQKALGAKNTKSYSNNINKATANSKPDTQNDLDEAISKPRKQSNKKKETIPEPDDAGSKTQSSKSSSKPGFCYIGEDRGFRSCIKVDDPNTCMSGEIFPTRDICINPTLRE